jgi:hypothetical protein
MSRAFEVRSNGPACKARDQPVPRSEQPCLSHVLLLPPQDPNKTRAKAGPFRIPSDTTRNAIA